MREPAGKPGSVVGSHSSGTRVTAGLKRPTRKRARISAATPCLRAPLLPYLALLRVGFAVPSSVTTDAVRSYRTVSPLPSPLARRLGGLLSVALSVGSRPPGVTWHPIRRSPDFPPHFVQKCSDCLAGSHAQDKARGPEAQRSREDSLPEASGSVDLLAFSASAYASLRFAPVSWAARAAALLGGSSRTSSATARRRSSVSGA